MAPPLSVIKIVKYCGVGGGGGGVWVIGGAKILQRLKKSYKKLWRPLALSVIKIEQYCGAKGGGPWGGGALGTLKFYKDNGAPSLAL